jgi:putative flippase GtrA
VLSHKLLRQVFLFGAVGLTATITNYVFAVAFHEHVGLNLYAAQLVGYCFAVFISLFGHSKFTFNIQLTPRVIVKFIVVSLTTLWLSEFILFCLENLLIISHRYSLFIVVITIPVITYFLSKLWVFHENRKA